MKYLSEQLQQAIQAIRERPTEEAVETIANIFMSIELEIGFLDQRRSEAEEAFNYWLEATMNAETKDEFEEDEEIENYIKPNE